MARDLTAKQRKFADFILKGDSGPEAFRKAGYSCGKKAVNAVKACEVAQAPNVVAYLRAEREKGSHTAILTREVSLRILAEIANDKKKSTASDRTRAIAQASKMQGYDAPQKIEMKLEGSLLHRIRNRGASTVSTHLRNSPGNAS